MLSVPKPLPRRFVVSVQYVNQPSPTKIKDPNPQIKQNNKMISLFVIKQTIYKWYKSSRVDEEKLKIKIIHGGRADVFMHFSRSSKDNKGNLGIA